MANERKTDIFISKLLDIAKIEYTPNGSDIKEIDKALKTASKGMTGNAGFPEFIAQIGDFILVIENKADTGKQANYADEHKTKLAMDIKSLKGFAENGALHYAQKIIEKTEFKKVFAFGCSGDEKHYIIKPIFVSKNDYKILDKVENFDKFTVENIKSYYRENVLGEDSPAKLGLKEFEQKVKELHESLRSYGQLGDKEKPLVVSAILLALSDTDFKIDSLTGDNVNTDGNKIYNALHNYITRVEVEPDVKKDKVLSQFNIIKDRTVLNLKDQRLNKTPLKYFTEYLQKNIFATITQSNGAEDVLGNFYSEFVRFSGGDGQTLGVVLTPSHITELFCDLVELKPSDKIFDPCCGTAGFLIAAMHKMIRTNVTSEEIKSIKKNQLHGIEIREDMFSIATTNMILRGDGKSNLRNEDFLKQNPKELIKENFTVGFMNPPYSQAKKQKDTGHLSEIRFIKHLLDSLAQNARCVVIVPQSTMVGKTKEDKTVKEQILKEHTLEGTITLNKNTFYRIGTNPCIAVFTAHKPHTKNKYCKFINFENDGWVINKHLGLVQTYDAKNKKQRLLDCWLNDKPDETKFMVKATIEANDEWLHSFYYFNDEIPSEADFEKAIADYLTFEFSMIMQGRGYLFNNEKEGQNGISK